MVAELIAVGTELLLGEIVDTNTAWLAADLADRGIDVLRSQRVGDNLQRVVEAIVTALSRSDLVVLCGGLGPTDDDLTREAIAAVLDEKPYVDSAQEATLRTWFARRNYPMPAQNLKQAWLITSAKALPNRHGTAPGWWVERGAQRLVALPGPPAELKPMWLDEAVSHLPPNDSTLVRYTFKTHNLGESAIAERLGDLTQSHNPSVATYARADGVHVRLAAKASCDAEGTALMAPQRTFIESCLGEHIWGTQEDTLVGVVAHLLGQAGMRLATLESLTGGGVAQLLTEQAGISEVFVGGGVAYSRQAKLAFGVDPLIVDQHGTVAEETARAMAEAARLWFGVDIGLATTGVAGPDPLEDKPVGQVHIAVATPWGPSERTVLLGTRGRQAVRERACTLALHLLREALRDGLPGGWVQGPAPAHPSLQV